MVFPLCFAFVSKRIFARKQRLRERVSPVLISHGITHGITNRFETIGWVFQISADAAQMLYFRHFFSTFASLTATTLWYAYSFASGGLFLKNHLGFSFIIKLRQVHLEKELRGSVFFIQYKVAGVWNNAVDNSELNFGLPSTWPPLLVGAILDSVHNFKTYW